MNVSPPISNVTSAPSPDWRRLPRFYRRLSGGGDTITGDNRWWEKTMSHHTLKLSFFKISLLMKIG
jgi:hypothetical protein